ncbi:MAG: hypothetical protein K9K76_04600 [Halanaerobiales bacterium]|nr:hypothetical protein [Halanaerobiales bacterium]
MKLKLLIIFLIIMLITSFASFVGAEGLNLEGQIESRLEISIKNHEIPRLSNNLKLDLEYYSSHSGLAKAIVQISDKNGNKISLKEVYTELYLSKTDLKIGKQIINWGKADGVNPTNNFNPEDLTRSFRDDNKIAVSALRAKHYNQNWIFDLVWAPNFTAPNFGEADDRWSFLLPNKVVMPENSIENSEFGIKASKWGTKMDFSFSYFRGYSKEPYISNIGEFKFYRVNSIGGDFARDFGSFVMRGEGAYFKPIEEIKYKEPYYKFILGVDKNFTDKIYVNTQYYRQKEGDINTAQKIILSTEYNITNFKKLGLKAVYNLEDEDYIINPTYVMDIRDNVSLTLGGYIFAGKKGTEYGSLDNKDYCYVELQNSF